ncbi:hypothetical protein JMJ35_001756 [Cladonia borealis]|uniref:Flavin reductase like domain-containing protein n=1 Tax=Cladonia borealis TaxID=184061 RepID=A0AA39R6B3_9LECA|nr:hypothetical protein JMJ35_001756 [Cladonia borealis]
MTSRYVTTSTRRLTRPSSVFLLRRAVHMRRCLSRREPLTNEVADSLKASKDTNDWDNLPLPEQVRSLMRPVPHVLTVITSFQPGQSPEDEPEPRGLLVSSFNTITLSPRPYVSFNIKIPSSTWDAIKASGYFTASGISNSTIAAAFAKGEAGSGDKATEGGWMRDWINKDGTLRDYWTAYWWMRCRCTIEESRPVGDHLIVVGEVVQAGEYEYGRTRMLRSPLLYMNGRYFRFNRPEGVLAHTGRA